MPRPQEELERASASRTISSWAERIISIVWMCACIRGESLCRASTAGGGHSVLWFGALALGVGLAYRSVMGSAWVAGGAALLYAINQEGYQATAWIAARNSILAAFFVALTVWSYHLHVQRRSWGWGVAALGALGMGLLAGEAAVVSVMYLLGYALVRDDRPWSSRIVSLFPPLALVGIWRMSYQALGYGAHYSGLYVDPGQDPLRYLLNLFEWAPLVLLNGATVPLLDGYASLAPTLKPWVWMAGSLMLAAITMAFLQLLRAERGLRFWAVGMVLAVIPACATTVPSGRSTLGAMLGFAPLAASFILGVVTNAAWVPCGRIGKYGCQATAIMLCICHFLWPLAGHAKRLGRLTKDPQRTVSAAKVWFDGAGREVVVLTSPDASALPYVPFLLAEAGKALPTRMRVLSSSFGALTVARVDTNVLRMTSMELPLIPTTLQSSRGLPENVWRHTLYHGRLLSASFRSDDLRMVAGEYVALPGMTVMVERVNERGMPMEVTFSFEFALEDHRYYWVYWDAGQGGYVPFSPPGMGAQCLLGGPLVAVRSSGMSVMMQ